MESNGKIAKAQDNEEDRAAYQGEGSSPRLDRWSRTLNNRKDGSVWSTEEEALLVELWPTMSSGLIARKLERSRSSVMGKVNRLQKEGRLQPIPRTSRTVQIAERPKSRPKSVPKPVSAWVSVPKAPPAPVPESGIPLIEAGASQCRAILGSTVAAMVCGKPVEDGSPYWFCPDHLKVYVRDK